MGCFILQSLATDLRESPIFCYTIFSVNDLLFKLESNKDVTETVDETEGKDFLSRFLLGWSNLRDLTILHGIIQLTI